MFETKLLGNCVNSLAHREYSSSYISKLIIEKDFLRTENANRARKLGIIDLNFYEPYAKNPKIAKVFREIGFSDELGSGFKNVVKYTKIYSGGVPEFQDGDIFRTKVPLNDNVGLNVPLNVPLNEKEKIIIKIIKEKSNVTQKELSELLSVNEKTIKRCMSELQEKNLIERIGSKKSGYWKVK